MDGRGKKDAGRGSMNSNSLNIKQQDHLRTDTQHFGSSSNSHHSARVDASSSRANSDQGLVDPEAGCSSSSSSKGLHSDVDHQLLRRGSSISGRMLENVTGGVFGKLRSSSYRSSSCKRKSCTSSSVSGSLSCGSHGSLRNGFRESNGGRTAARIHNGMSRRTMGIGGCTSASDVVVSTSSAQAAAAGRSSGLPGSQRTVLSDCHMNPNEHNSSSSSSSSSLIPNEILTASSTSTRCQSGSSSVVGGSRSGTSFSPRHRDASSLGFSGGGERLSHRYLGRSRTHSIISALEHVERDEDLTYEQLLMLEATLLFGGLRLRDQHSDLRLDVDNMSYEELLALEDRIGNVSTGLTAEAVAEKLKRSYYSSLDVVGAQFSQEYDTKCSICQEEYEDGDKLGKIECGHSYHALCIQQWLVQKNQCPICKATAFAH
ncbi:unnamed protein product [Sphagnum balticum]